MDSSLQPPFIADVLCYLLIIALFYLVYYSFNLRKEILNQRFEQLMPQPAPVVNKKPQQSHPSAPGKLHIFIEPSPTPGQKVPFPSIFSMPELTLSVIVPVYNMQDSVIGALEKIQNYFSEKREKHINNDFESNDNFSYEIIVIDMLSTDNTYSIVYDFALKNPEFRILKIPFGLSLNYSIIIGATRIRGKLLFIYLPQEDLPLNVYSQLEHKIESARNKYDSREIVALACLADIDDQKNGSYDINDYEENNNEIQNFSDEHYQTLLSLFLDYITSKLLLCSTNFNAKAGSHFRTMLLTREATQVLFTNIKLSGDWFDQELLVIAARERMTVSCTLVEPGNYYGSIIDISSWERIFRFLDLLQNLLLYSTGVWKVVRKA